MTLREKIVKIAPDAVITESGDTMFTLVPDDFIRVAEALRKDADEPHG